MDKEKKHKKTQSSFINGFNIMCLGAEVRLSVICVAVS